MSPFLAGRCPGLREPRSVGATGSYSRLAVGLRCGGVAHIYLCRSDAAERQGNAGTGRASGTPSPLCLASGRFIRLTAPIVACPARPRSSSSKIMGATGIAGADCRATPLSSPAKSGDESPHSIGRYLNRAVVWRAGFTSIRSMPNGSPGCCHLVTADDSLRMTCRRNLFGEN